jgi:hypothetical protein
LEPEDDGVRLVFFKSESWISVQGIPLVAPPVSSIRKDGFLGRRSGSSSGGGTFTLRKTWKSLWVEQANDMLYFFKDSQAKKVRI